MRHFVNLDLDAGRVIPFDIPPLGAHIPRAEQVDRAIALAHYDAAVDDAIRAARHGGVDADVQFDQRVCFFLVEVAAFGGFAHAVEAVDLHIRCERQSSFEGVEPRSGVVFVGFDFLARVRDAVRVAVAHLLVVPRLALREEVVEAFRSGEVLEGEGGALAVAVAVVEVVAEVEQVAEGHSLARLVVWCPGRVAPDGFAALGQHAGDAWHGAEDLSAFLLGKELLQPVDGERVQLRGVSHFTRQHGREALDGAQHAPADVHPVGDVAVDPVLAAFAVVVALDPFEEVHHHLRAHAMRRQRDLLALYQRRRLDVRLQPAKILIAHLEIRIRQPPVVRCRKRIRGVISNRCQILQDLIPDPVARDEEVCRIEPLRRAQLDAPRIQPRFLI